MSRPRIVHLGLGNFHRAHQAVYTAEAAPDWTITGVANRNRTIVDALQAQAHRYTVLTLDDSGVRAQSIECITETLVAAEQSDAVVARIADPDTHVITLTVTEAGYAMRPGTADLDLDAVRADLADARHPRRPRTIIGLLADGLACRADRGGAPIAVVSCDNVTANGPTLRRLLGQFAEAAGRVELAAYLAAAVDLPSTMVDRIVPATSAEHIALARAAGYPDAVPVAAEPFRQWVISPHFRAGRPGWERAGAVFSEDVAGYETVKVRLLNGSHSLIAYLGLLSGHHLMATAFANESVQRAVDALIAEYLPTLDVPAGLDIDRYVRNLRHRFANRALAHRTAQVGTDGSLKLGQRVVPAALWHVRGGEVPSALALVVAAFLCCFGWPGAGDWPTDPAAERIRELALRQPEPLAFAQTVLCDEALLGFEIAAYPDFAQRVGEHLAVLSKTGVAAAVADLES
ncbi:fructuronate reductase [Catenulispora sp. GAS73]|uniref:mannitol dehydrogenase family protein n=1 Tax=Catenulispora sp. GAS73 TaxID=3156269 RepID=UPI0035146BCE